MGAVAVAVAAAATHGPFHYRIRKYIFHNQHRSRQNNTRVLFNGLFSVVQSLSITEQRE